jgi:GT2 family glycosyltransferase
MTGSSPDASIVIPVYNQVFFTRVCLASLDREVVCAEKIVVDNGSTDGTPDLLAAWASNGHDRRYLRYDRNLGFARSCNTGADVASSDVIVFLNNDTFVLDGWLSNLLKPFSDPAVKVTGSRLLYPSGHLQHAGVAFNEIGPFHAFMGLPGDLPFAQEQRDYQVVTGASMAIRADEFRALGGFDTSYQNSFEDVDLCLRVRQRGGRVVYVPGSVAYHFESMTEGRLDETDRRNYEHFIARWGGHYELDLGRIEQEATAAGNDLTHDRIETRRETVDRQRGAAAELMQLRSDVQRLRDENAGLRHIAQMRSVRTALWARNVFRRMVPS